MSVENEELVKLSHRGAQIVHRSRTHRYSTQPVACIRGYEPSGASYRDSEPDCSLFQATFQANTKTTAMHAYLQSLLRQCNGIIVTSNII